MRRGHDDNLGRGRTHRLVQVAHDVDLHAGVVRVLVRLGSVTLDDQLVIAVRLHVQVSLARIADHFHRQVVLDTVIEHDCAVQRADLRALVADDRARQAEAFHPGHCAGKGPTGAGDRHDAGGHDVTQSFDVARVEVQLHVQDRAVQVQRKQPVTKGQSYRLASGLTRFGGRPPRTAVAMLRAAMADISERVRTVALAMCGASTTLGIGMR